MIRVVLRGDVGNQLFQYAVGRHLAKRHGVPLVLNVARRLSLRDPVGAALLAKLGHLRLDAQFERVPAPWLRLAARLGSAHPPWVDYREPRWGFCPEVLDLPDGVALSGYFQSPAYFEAVAPMVRQDFSFTQAWPHDRARRLADDMVQVPSVAVHVRRGDYLRSPLHRVCTLAYYQRAMGRMRRILSKPRFYVFSDDIPWCQEHLPLTDGCHIDLADTPGQPMVDLRLMRHCRHHIIANSTFSWWGAWLAAHPRQKVIAPNRWFNDPALDAQAMRHTVPAVWERMPV